MKNEVIMVGGRKRIRQRHPLTGAKLVLVRRQRKSQFGSTKTPAMIYTTHLGDELRRSNAIAKKVQHPDAAR